MSVSGMEQKPLAARRRRYSPMFGEKAISVQCSRPVTQPHIHIFYGFMVGIAILVLDACCSAECHAMGLASSEANWNRRTVALYDALVAKGLADRRRALVHLVQVCEIVTGTRRLMVVEIRELVRGGPSPRGVNHVVFMTQNLAVRGSLEIDGARPYYCVGQQLVLDQELYLDGLGQAGNVLVIGPNGKIVGVRTLEAADMTGFDFGKGRRALKARP